IHGLRERGRGAAAFSMGGVSLHGPVLDPSHTRFASPEESHLAGGGNGSRLSRTRIETGFSSESLSTGTAPANDDRVGGLSRGISPLGAPALLGRLPPPGRGRLRTLDKQTAGREPRRNWDNPSRSDRMRRPCRASRADRWRGGPQREPRYRDSPSFLLSKTGKSVGILGWIGRGERQPPARGALLAPGETGRTGEEEETSRRKEAPCG